MAGLQNVLLVEDDVMIRDLYRATVVHGGHTVKVAGSGNEAYVALKTFRPDIVFLDIMLPGQSGLDILKELRTKPALGCQKSKIMMLTNLAQQDLIDKAMSSGADGYIVKADILPNDLITIIKSFENQDSPSR